jgi:hypothetical protein
MPDGSLPVDIDVNVRVCKARARRSTPRSLDPENARPAASRSRDHAIGEGRHDARQPEKQQSATATRSTGCMPASGRLRSRPSLLDHRFQASTIMSCLGKETLPRVGAVLDHRLLLRQAERSSHRRRHRRCCNSSSSTARSGSSRASATAARAALSAPPATELSRLLKRSTLVETAATRPKQPAAPDHSTGRVLVSFANSTALCCAIR